MTAISEIAGYVPTGRVSNLERQQELGIDEAFIRSKLGVCTVSRMAADEDTSDLCVAAFNRLVNAERMRSEGVDCLVVCTQNPDGRGIPHTSAIVHGKLGLPEACAAFDVSLGCSGYVYGLWLVQSLMTAGSLNRALLFTADPYSKIVDPNDKNTAVLFGDAGSVTLLEADADPRKSWRARGFVLATRGAEGAALNNRGGLLAMNGRAVFNFAATVVPQQVTECLKRAALRSEDVDLFLFHQGSKYIIDTLQRRLELPPEKVPLDLVEHGNTVSSSIPLMLAERLADPKLNRILLSGFGVGLSWGTCVLERSELARR
jgi:3-oxoacyl-[acyl-carrier-protein] synthase III